MQYQKENFLTLKYPKLNILVAFPYFKQSIFNYLQSKDPNSFRLIIDSGAFTAWNTGKFISLDKYCEFLKNIPKEWEYKVVQLDVYGNPKETYINYMKMLDMGMKDIMPVFTRGDTEERLNEFYNYTDYIMFGGIAIGGENTNYVKWFCETNKDRKAHWLGFVNVPFMKKYKPYSVDSSSMFSTMRWGQLQVYMGNGRLKSVHKRKFNKKPNDELIQCMVKAGCDIKEISLLSKLESWDGGKKNLPWRKGGLKGLASFITVKSHVKRGVDLERNVGTKIYFAASGVNQLEDIFDAYKILQERKCI